MDKPHQEKKVRNSRSPSTEAQWLKTIDPDDWLLEEYKLLSDHYFHEDTEYRETLHIYITVNVGLLAFFGSSFYQSGTILDYFIPIIGIILCLSWLATMVRLREWRNYLEYRIRTIETNLQKHWAIKSEFVPLDIRIMKDWKQTKPKLKLWNLPAILLRDMPSSISLFIIPTIFVISWIVFLIIRIV